ncbi:DEAD/DEAH box helicase family protein [Virgibacillus sp. JSM 102003]|uniref:TOTE conflict system archaeo-eukaryotic primase domain-containing protein n=1 Tax=Virgibacillus sp. JSM 102003 TaxID=1562108 RepID=UPI0035C1B806
MGYEMENKHQKALNEIEWLKKENSRLRQLLQHHQIHDPLNELEDSTKAEKLKKRVNLFRSLFKGREDVFAYRWEVDNGKAGYSPARSNDSFQPFTDKVIYNHLTGEKTIGLYPVLLDNSCWFLAIDFDKKSWREDVHVFMQTCSTFGVPASVERSRSGNGCHVWIFFQEPIQADVARNLGTILLSKAMEKSSQNGLNSYDRMFPNQDSVPKGKFGNLIALPLQGGPRKNGNSVFVDEKFNPYKDQWLYLSKVKRLSKKDVESIVARSHNSFVVKESPISVESSPEKINVLYKNGIYISKQNLPQSLIKEIAQLAKFSNPAFYQAEKKRLSTKEIPRVIDCSEEAHEYLFLPRGCIEELKILMEKKSIEIVLNDEAILGKSINVQFYGKLSLQQEEVVQAMLENKTGILSAATGFGKTVVAASIIAKRQVNTLVIVHRKQLIDQWKERLASFFKIDPKSIGQIGGGKNTAIGFVDIATIQSLNHGGIVKDSIKKYGQIIVDECHHLSAFTFEKVLKEADAAYVHGLTATPKRKDGLDPIMRMQLGPIRYKISAKDQAKVRPFKHILLPRYTGFKSAESDIQALYSELVSNESRNELIFNDVLSELEQGAAPIILTERIEHVKKLEAMFEGFTKNLIVLTGEMTKREERMRLTKLEKLSDDQERLVIATGKYIGEGFDNARLDTMFLTIPISWKGTLQQYVGRLHRLHERKTTVKVYDYVDHNVQMFQKMFKNRKKGYKTLGYVNKESSSEVVTQQMNLF